MKLDYHMIYISNNDARNHPILINSLGMYLPWTILCRFPSFHYAIYFMYSKLKNEQICPHINLPPNYIS